jgi:hypothetical protein
MASFSRQDAESARMADNLSNEIHYAINYTKEIVPTKKAHLMGVRSDCI